MNLAGRMVGCGGIQSAEVATVRRGLELQAQLVGRNLPEGIGPGRRWRWTRQRGQSTKNPNFRGLDSNRFLASRFPGPRDFPRY